ncbi:MAG: tripartite tricarboxylate transporter substrate binding protein [Betaproteobacteria bacterium]|nr:tripartite tricarboxylate transporter substrate binding protein [Betaproteobacteria bacterium]
MKMQFSNLVARFLAAFVPLASIGLVHAQTYPSRPILLVAPFSPGGGTDFSARIIAQKLSESLGQQIVVQNITGSSGNIGAERVAKSPPDGYTLLMASSPNAIAGILFKQVYDFVRDFVAIVQIGSNAQVLVVNPVVPANSVGDLIRLAKQKPGILTYGSAGAGAFSHLGGELLGLNEKIKLTHVPYKGAAVALIGVIGGEVDMAFITVSSAKPYIGTKRLKLIAVASPKRSVIAPEVPTFDEQGIRNFYLSTWYGVHAPRSVPAEVVKRLNGEIVRILSLPEVEKRMLDQGIEIATGSPEEYARHVENEVNKWRKVIREAKLPLRQ